MFELTVDGLTAATRTLMVRYDRQGRMCGADDATRDEHTFRRSRAAGLARPRRDARPLTPQIATALDCTECCIYEYLPDRPALRAQAIWSDEAETADRAWIGRTTPLAAIADFQAVIATHESSFVRRRTGAAGPSDPADMTYWGELAAVWAPIVANDEVLGVLELTEKHAPRRFW